MKTAFLRLIKSTNFQLIAMLFAAIYIPTILVLQYKKLLISEETPTLIQVDEKIKNLATPVTVGMHINCFPDFSFNQNNFSIDAIVWFKFAKATESLDTLKNFTLKNSRLLGDGSLIYKSPPIIKVLDKDVLVCYHIQATFMTDLKYKNFPIGDHRLNILLQNKSATAEELVFVTESKNLTTAENMLIENWIPKKTHATAGYVNANLNAGANRANITYPCVAFSVDFESVGARLPVSLYFPLFLLFFIVLMSLILNISDTNRIGLVASGVPALVLFRLIIDSVSPRVGYVTHIDVMYYLIVLLSLLILFFQTYVTLIWRRQNAIPAAEKQTAEQMLENISAIIFLGVLVSLVITLTFTCM